MERLYLYRNAKHAFTPSGRCWIRLGVSAGALALIMLGCGIFSASLHLQHAMTLPLFLAVAVLAVWAAAGLIFLPRSQREQCSASFIVCEPSTQRIWFLTDFALSGDAAQDIAAADALVGSEAFQNYPDLTQATATLAGGTWVLAGLAQGDKPKSYPLSAVYQRVGDAPLPPERGNFAGNVVCAALLAVALLGSILFVAFDRAREYRGLAHSIDEITALVTAQYPDYILSPYSEPHPGESSLRFEHKNREDDYWNGTYFGDVYLSVAFDGDAWHVEYINCENWYTDSEDFAAPLALARSLSADFDALPLSQFDARLAQLRAEYTALLADMPDSVPDDDFSAYSVNDTLAKTANYKQGIQISISVVGTKEGYYTDIPADAAGCYDFVYNNYT
ncbi:MAG: hypothetical protein LKJ90_08535 [Faecalibacterium sp.]|nr:hypothetical protein [Faecalibacterium sp.]